jgi:hypothetical protein
MLFTNDIAAWNASGAGKMGNPYLLALHLLLWALLVAGWVLLFRNRPPIGETRHAPGFTDDRERTALSLFATGIAAKWAYDSRLRRQNQQQINNGQGPW